MTTTTYVLPTFGLIQIEPAIADWVDGERVTDGEFVGCLGQNDMTSLDDLTIEQLRRLAADALAAAEWMESEQ